MKHAYALCTLGLLGLAASASAQTLTNNGATLTVGSGATLYVSGGFENKSGSTLLNNGTLQVTGDVTNAGTVDAAGTGTLSLTGTTNQALNTAGASFANITVDKATAGSNEVTVPTDVTVTGQLLLTNGVVRTAQAAKVVLGTSATLTGETAGRYVKGNLQMQRTGVSGNTLVTFPDGTRLAPNSNNLGTITLTRTAGLNIPDVSYGTNNNGNKGIDRIWRFVADGTQPSASRPVTITLGWVSDDDNGNTNLTQSRVWRRATVPLTGPWVTQQTPVDASSRSISSPADELGYFSVSNIANPLPVELLSFTAERRGTDGLLRWATAQEKDNARFEVEVSTDGQQFRRLGTVAGQGTSTTRHDYEYLDARLARYGAPLLYYRLRQVDTNGKETLSPVRTLSVEAGSFAAQALPNPFGGDGLKVTVRTAEAGPATLSLHDAVGRVLISQQSELPVGGATLSLQEAGKLSIGVYFLTVRQGKQQATLKVVRE
ncbi:T9SS type A sorting domain-containing protein [Hymenobacter gummosus]|nr:T9SS type A sorting domain-containing protein [Hymenobacter gummosus]